MAVKVTSIMLGVESLGFLKPPRDERGGHEARIIEHEQILGCVAHRGRIIDHQGLVLDARGEIYVEPKLKFDVTGFVLVEADLLLTTIELYSKRWQLAGFEYGSGLRFGVTFPIHYEEGKPFDISLSDMQFQIPDIKPSELLTNLIKQIA